MQANGSATVQQARKKVSSCTRCFLFFLSCNRSYPRRPRFHLLVSLVVMGFFVVVFLFFFSFLFFHSPVQPPPPSSVSFVSSSSSSTSTTHPSIPSIHSDSFMHSCVPCWCWCCCCVCACVCVCVWRLSARSSLASRPT